MDHQQKAGVLLFVGSVQFVVGMVVAEALYPGYSVSLNYISDLGVGPTAAIFNSSVFLLGLMTTGSAYFIHRRFRSNVFTVLIALAGIGAVGVGVFPGTTGLPHFVATATAFLFGGLSAIVAYRLVKEPLNYLSVILGAFSLLALVLLPSQVLLGLGKGGMERMIVYPTLVWQTAFGGYLMSGSDSPPS